MKKKLCILALSLCVTASFAACGGNNKSEVETNTEANAQDSEDGETSTDADAVEVTADTRIVSVSAEDMEKYVTLGDYKGISVQQDVEEVTDGDIDLQINNTLSESAVESEDPEAAIKSGDIANINYKGTKDGVAFDGGTADNYDLTIGSGSFIDGFEDGLIGAKKGEVKELNLTFPENYPSEELAGQEVVFTVTVNEIKTVPELTDEWVKENTEFDTAEAYRQSIRENMEANNEEAARTTALNNAWSQVVDSCEVKEYPKEDLEAAKKEFEDSLQSYADQQQMEVDEFLESQGTTREEFDEQTQQYAEYKVKQNLVVQAIMDKEGFNLIDDKCKDAEKELATNFGVDDISALVEEYGQASINESIALTRVSNFVSDNAKVSTSIATEDNKQGFDADAAEAASEAEMQENSGEDEAK